MTHPLANVLSNETSRIWEELKKNVPRQLAGAGASIATQLNPFELGNIPIELGMLPKETPRHPFSSSSLLEKWAPDILNTPEAQDARHATDIVGLLAGLGGLTRLSQSIRTGRNISRGIRGVDPMTAARQEMNLAAPLRVGDNGRLEKDFSKELRIMSSDRGITGPVQQGTNTSVSAARASRLAKASHDIHTHPLEGKVLGIHPGDLTNSLAKTTGVIQAGPRTLSSLQEKAPSRKYDPTTYEGVTPTQFRKELGDSLETNIPEHLYDNTPYSKLTDTGTVNSALRTMDATDTSLTGTVLRLLAENYPKRTTTHTSLPEEYNEQLVDYVLALPKEVRKELVTYGKDPSKVENYSLIMNALKTAPSVGGDSPLLLFRGRSNTDDYVKNLLSGGLRSFSPDFNLASDFGSEQLKTILVSPKTPLLPPFSPYTHDFDISKGPIKNEIMDSLVDTPISELLAQVKKVVPINRRTLPKADMDDIKQQLIGEDTYGPVLYVR